jgi:hypothetical protein
VARMSDAEFKALINRRGGSAMVWSPIAGQKNIPNPDYDPDIAAIDPTDPRAKRYLSSTDVQQWVSPEGHILQAYRTPEGDWEVIQDEPPKPNTATPRTPEQTTADKAVAAQQQIKERQMSEEEREQKWNQVNGPGKTAPAPDSPDYPYWTGGGGSGFSETHAQRAEREQKAAQAAEDDRRLQQQAEETRNQNQTGNRLAQARIDSDEKDRAAREREGAAGRALTAAQIGETARHNQSEETKPNFLSDASANNQFVVRYDPKSGQMVQEANPNYDAVKAAAEERRKELSLQIQSGQLDLEGAKQMYTQWFDTNVRAPLMLSEEARSKAAEQRAALDAEERRRQFAADFGLRKASLGEQASGRAVNAEISTLPYRSGPTWGEDISSAINSLGGGGKVSGPDAGAGIHFSDSSFAFDKPDFDAIAKRAAHQVLSGLTDYRPSDQQYATADYSGVPQVNLSNMPTYQYTPVALPPPSPGATQP